jgi:serine/threonine protein kinase
MLRTLHGVASGMEWLHARNVLHGDLKAGNVMLQYRHRPAPQFVDGPVQSGGSLVQSGSSGASAEAVVQELMEGGPGALAAAVAGGVVALAPKVADFGLSRCAIGQGQRVSRWGWRLAGLPSRPSISALPPLKELIPIGADLSPPLLSTAPTWRACLSPPARVIGEGATHLSTHTVGTITHQSPELIRTGRLSKPADAFSFGVISERPAPR